MAQTTSADFKTARNNQDYPTKKVELLLPNLSKPNKYGCVATADSEAIGFEATHTNDGNRTRLGGYWKGNNGTETPPTFWSKLENATDITSPQVGPAGTIVGSPTYSACKFNNGMYVTAGSEGFTITPTAEDVINHEQGCVEFWLKPDYAFDGINTSDDAAHLLFNMSSSAQDGQYLMIVSDTVGLQCQYYSGGWINVTTTSVTWAAGELVHLALVWNRNGINGSGDYVRIYANGIEVAHNTANIPTDSALTILRMGHWYNVDYPADAVFDNIRIYAFQKTDFSNRNTEIPPKILPTFWSKLESATDITSPQIGSSGTTIGTPTYAAGKFNNGIYSNAAEGFLIDSPGYSKDVGCIEFWYKPDYAGTDNARHCIFGEYRESGSPLGDYLSLIKDTDNKLYFTICRNGWINANAPVSWSAGDLMHITCVWDSAGLSEGGTTYYHAIYLNDTFFCGNTSSVFNDWINDGLYVGLMPPAGSETTYCDGVIDNFKIYHYAKTDFSDKDIEIPPRMPPTYWSKIENASDITSPQIGSTGTMTGSPTFNDCKFSNGMLVNQQDEGFYIPSSGLYSNTKGCVEFWYKPSYPSNDAGNYAIIGSPGCGSSPDCTYLMFNNGSLEYAICRSGWIYINTTSFSWSANDLVHFGLVWDSNGFSVDGTIYYQALYINGIFVVGSEVTNWGGTWIAGNFFVGYWAGDPRNAAGVIDNLRIYNYPKRDFSDKDTEIPEGVALPTGILTHTLLPGTNSLKEYATSSEFDAGILTDVQDTEETGKVRLNGFYDVSFLPEWENCKCFLKMDGAAGSGIESDISGNNNDAIEYGSVPSDTGIIGNCRGNFSSDNYFRINSTDVNSSDNFSISFWGKRKGAGETTFIHKGGNDGTYHMEYAFEYQTMVSGKISCYLVINNSPQFYQHYLTSTTTLADDTMYLFTMTYDRSIHTLKLYVNNVLEATDSTIEDYPTNIQGNNLIIGKTDSIYYTWPGTNLYVDEFMFYDKTLSAANIATLYASGSPYRRLSSGTWQSDNIDWGFVPVAGSGTSGISWEEELATNTTLVCQAQYSTDGINWGSVSPYTNNNWSSISNNGTLDLARYCRFKFTFETSDQLYSPSLNKVSVSFTPLTRKLGQINLYGYTGENYISEFKLQYWDGLEWADITPTKLWGYKRNQTSAPSVTNVAEVITSTAEEIYIQFDEIETNKIRLNITGTSNGEAPTLCEMEVCQRIQLANSEDRSKNYFMSFNCNRNLDYLGRWFQGMDWNMQLMNDKRNFSPNYKPSTDEIANGYFNDFLSSPCKVQVWAGYDNEDVLICSGFVDSISIDSGSNTATLSGRDNYYLLTKKDLTVSNDEVATKTIENCIEYVLNKCNIPSSQITMATTGITLDYFFFLNQKPVDALKNLIEATGNAFLVNNELNRFEMFYKNQERKWIESATDQFKLGNHTNTSWWDKEGSVILDIQNGNTSNHDFETSGGQNCSPPKLSWWKCDTKGNGYSYQSSEAAQSGTYGAKISNCYPFHTYCDFPARVKIEISDEHNNVLMYDLWNVTSNFTRYTKSLSGLRNRLIRVRIMTAVYSQNNGTSQLYPENSGDIESGLFYCSGMPISFYCRAAATGTGSDTSFYYILKYHIDNVEGGRRSYITPGTFISQSHDCTKELEEIANFTTAKAGINKPINTTMTFYIQYSIDNDAWGINDGVYDDNNWQSLTMTDINGNDVTNSAVEIIGDATGNIPDPGDKSDIRYIRYKCVMTNTDNDLTPELQEMRINWETGAGSTMSTTPSFTYGYEGASMGQGLLKSLQNEETSIESNNARVYTNTTAVVNALYESTSVEEVWDGMQDQTNLVFETSTTLCAELEYPTKLGVSSTVLTITEGAGTTTYNATESGIKDLASHASTGGTVEVIWGTQKVQIILALTDSVTFTVFKIEGYPYKEKQKIEVNVEADNYASLVEDFGEMPNKIDNEFIFSHSIAEEVATAVEKYYQHPRSKISGLRVAFTPDAQLLDCIQIYDYNSGIQKNFWITELGHDLSDRGSTNLTVEEI